MALSGLPALIAGSAVFLFVAGVGHAETATEMGKPQVDEDIRRHRDVVPLPPVPEVMAVPTPTETADVTPSPDLPPPPALPSPKPPKLKHHRKAGTPKPARGIEKL